ncbi:MULTISPECIES: hypothetical protein [Streptomyces]|uniref:DUF2771 domain-containing protein n=1 Tax=Streptomyces lycii TaxID=2654337 RepID=A0ABQ7FMW4_9ACTN|nr:MULTISPECIES: hypothetical protein [Streptomyces]KAF4409968.1 hypothetical protein GCU69_06340 [Streptomyces lycii]PGH49021.1 hypothetical protein CRI70_20055 [Streptomyces sp. Ru87]
MTVAKRPSRTTTQSRGRARRTAAALGAVTLGLAALAACDKPTPMATVTVGSDSASAEASCWNDGKKLSEKDLQSCLTKKQGEKLTVSDGEQVRIGVEPEIAESGWAMVVNGQGTMPEASKDTYRSFDHDEIFAPQQGQSGAASVPKTAQVTIVEVDNKGAAKGTWSFTLERASS